MNRIVYPQLPLWANQFRPLGWRLGCGAPDAGIPILAFPLISFEALFVVISQKLLIWNKSFGKLYTQPFIVQQQRSG